MSSRLIAFLTSAAMTLSVAPARASVLAEVPDAGNLPSTAQVATGSGPLTQITGRLESNDPIDMFQIYIDAGGGFSARVASTTPVDDTKLYLFDSLGRGILADDDSAGGFLSALPNSHLSGLAAGIYYLAIADFDFIPVSSSGNIFNGGNLQSPLNSNPVIGWTNDVHEAPYSYVINLTGASFVGSAVPEPMSLALMAVGGLGIMAAGRRRRRSAPGIA